VCELGAGCALPSLAVRVHFYFYFCCIFFVSKEVRVRTGCSRALPSLAVSVHFFPFFLVLSEEHVRAGCRLSL